MDAPGTANGTGTSRGDSKLSSDAVVVLSTGAAVITTMLAGFIGLFIMISNLHVTREERLEVVREIVRDDVELLDSRIRAIEVGQASLEGRREAEDGSAVDRQSGS